MINIRSMISELIQTERTIQYIQKDGEKRYEILVLLISNPDDKESLILYYSRDVSGQVKAEEM